ncbi:hypothetical protein [Arthrobacter cavernae]|uniref:LPXTG cell wall anchor domain-containing protein n=1 Tax=Arthrobacter cavernae TaxID=2817681 RepID=A0A939HF26_9MICC|nr:hypothetical protein [Arthrobacter cavernae]MBO1266711.1 hypothetical protein [Arthrobacter cavernae]
MRRIFALAGIVGLALLGTSAPANAHPHDDVEVCEEIDNSGPSHGDRSGPGPSGPAHGDRSGPGHGCVPMVAPPAPVVVPPAPVVVPPMVTPVVPAAGTTVVPAVVAPAAAPAAAAMAQGAAAPMAVNPGFNAQTAAGTTGDSGLLMWPAGVALLLMALATVRLRRRARIS